MSFLRSTVARSAAILALGATLALPAAAQDTETPATTAESGAEAPAAETPAAPVPAAPGGDLATGEANLTGEPPSVYIVRG